MNTLCIILARAGSKGLASKNVTDLMGRPLIEYTFDYVQAAGSLDVVVLSTDEPRAVKLAEQRGIACIDRPAELADDTATIDAAARHAVEVTEAKHGRTCDTVVICYGNIPLRPTDLIDRAVGKLRETGCDSVQSVYPVGKTHPLWMRKLTGPGGDMLEPYEPNQIYRRQDLPPVYMLSGGVIAVSRRSLFNIVEGQPHAFLGSDQRGIVTAEADVVDVDDALDLSMAKAVLEHRATGQTAPAVRIGQRRIAPGEPTYIIAELGVNHDGSVGRAIELTHAAHAAGADAIKLQFYDTDALLSADAKLAAYQRMGEDDPHTMLRRLQLSLDDMQRISGLCRELRMGFVVTCFNRELVESMRQLDVDVVKIASPDAVNLPLIESMLTLRKPMIVSTGTCDLRELTTTVQRCGEVPLALLHCVSAYPTPIDQANLGRIGALASRFGRPVGYSDHTPDALAGPLAVAQGARIIEKHLTYDTAAAGPDHAASFDPAQFAEYVDAIRAAELMLGSNPHETQQAERDVRRVSRQSLCATRDLPAGHVIERDDLTIKRPGTGIPAADLNQTIGRRLSRPTKANHLLHVEDLEEVSLMTAHSTQAVG